MSGILPLLEAHANADRVADMRRYHKTERVVLGVSNPQIDTAVRDWRADRPVPELIAEAAALWDTGVFEARIAAAKLLTKARFPTDEAAVWDLIVRWVPDFDGWAIADHAAGAGGRRIMADLSRLDTVEDWTEDPSFWVRRSALIFTLSLAKLNHLSPEEAQARRRVLGWAAGYVDDREWFIQKAIGWWLRTLSKHEADAVRAFIETYGDRMKPFARREALRHLPEG